MTISFTNENSVFVPYSNSYNETPSSNFSDFVGAVEGELVDLTTEVQCLTVEVLDMSDKIANIETLLVKISDTLSMHRLSTVSE